MTIDCDEENMSRAAEGVDMDCKWHYASHYDVSDDQVDWFMENITTLCTTQCSSSLRSWLSAVEEDCAADTLDFMGSIMQAKTVPAVYTTGHDIACLQDRSEIPAFLLLPELLTLLKPVKLVFSRIARLAR